MRTTPSSVSYASLTTTSANTISAVGLNQPTTTVGMVDATSSSLTSGNTYIVMGNNTTGAYIAFNAEL